MRFLLIPLFCVASFAQGLLLPVSGASLSTGFNGFSHKIQLTYDHTKVGGTTEDESNFPAVVYKSDVNLKTTGNGGYVNSSVGADVLAFSDSGCSTQIASFLKSYDGTNGIVSMRVKIATLSHSSNGSIYLCVGNAAPPARTSGAFDSNFTSVWPLGNGSTLSLTDVQGNFNLTNHSVAASASGLNDGAGSFVAATPTWLDAGSPTAPGSGDVSVWVWMKSSTVAPMMFVQAFATNLQLATRTQTGGSQCEGVFNGATYIGHGGSILDGVWHMCGFVRASGTCITYLDGAAVTSSSSGCASTLAAGFLIGTFSGGSVPYDGLMQDIAYSATTARSAGWVSTEYQTNFNAASFWTFGSWI